MRKRKLVRPAPSGSKQGTALDVIRDAEFPLIASLWKGTPVLLKVRELSDVQLKACGDISLINLGELTEGPFVWSQWVSYADTLYKILRLTMVSPTYEEVFALIGKGTMITDSERRFREIDTILLDLPRGPGRQMLEKERDSLRCLFDFILPDDFVAPIVAYAVGLQKSDIKLLTRSMLLDAAVLADRGHDNPADHIYGQFTEFNRDDINRRAWQVLGEWKQEHTRDPAQKVGERGR